MAVGLCTTWLAWRLGLLAHLHDWLGQYEILAAFVAGALFVSTITIPLAASLFIALTADLPVWQIGLWGGLGAVMSDLAMLMFFRHEAHELRAGILDKLLRRKKTKNFLHSRLVRWTLPLLGAAIIASPLPDELGVSLIGITKLKLWQFAPLSYAANSLGIWMLLGVSEVLHFV